MIQQIKDLRVYLKKKINLLILKSQIFKQLNNLISNTNNFLNKLYYIYSN